LICKTFFYFVQLFKIKKLWSYLPFLYLSFSFLLLRAPQPIKYVFIFICKSLIDGSLPETTLLLFAYLIQIINNIHRKLLLKLYRPQQQAYCYSWHRINTISVR
jgi:hypothetical protein